MLYIYLNCVIGVVVYSITCILAVRVFVCLVSMSAVVISLSVRIVS